MPRLLHRKRRGAPTPSSVIVRPGVGADDKVQADPGDVGASASAGAGAGAGADANATASGSVTLKVLGIGSGQDGTPVAPIDIAIPSCVDGRSGAGAASAAGEVLASVWDLPPLGGHEGAAAELRDELCRLAAVAVEQRRREEELDSRQKQIEKREAELQHWSQQQGKGRRDDHLSGRQQLQEQLKVALSRIDNLSKDLNKLNELEEDFKTQILHLETLANDRERAEKEHRLKLESIELERQEWLEKEAEYQQKIEELRSNMENTNKAIEENMRVEIGQLQNECNSRGEEITKLESKVANLEESNDLLRGDVRILQDKISALEQQCLELREHIDHLEMQPSDEMQQLSKKVEALEELDRHSGEVILDLQQAMRHLEAADSANHEVNASLGARVQAAEMQVVNAAALRERLIELLGGLSVLIPHDAIQSDADLLSAVQSVFDKFKMDEQQREQRIQQMQERINEFESTKQDNDAYYEPQQLDVSDTATKDIIESLQEKLAQTEASEQEARAMLEELQAKLRYLESAERQDKDMLLNLQSKVRFSDNPEQQMEAYAHLEAPPDHAALFQHPDELLGQHPLELQHQFLHQHLHHNQLQFHVQYPPDFGFQLHARKDVPSRHHLPSLQPMQPLQALQPLQTISLPVPITMPQPPPISKGAKKKQRQCFKCQKFGHLAKQCSGETTCVVCGVRGHTHNECNNNEARCANCHGPHRASSKTCPVRISWCATANREAEPLQLAQS